MKSQTRLQFQSQRTWNQDVALTRGVAAVLIRILLACATIFVPMAVAFIAAAVALAANLLLLREFGDITRMPTPEEIVARSPYTAKLWAVKRACGTTILLCFCMLLLSTSVWTLVLYLCS